MKKRKNGTAGQLSFKQVSGWGGKRRGSGRPRKSRQVSHGKRELVKSSTPLHLTWRLRGDLVNLRCGEVLAAFKRAAAGARKYGLRLVHYSIQHNHLHLIVETDSNQSLGMGMRSFGGCFGKALRKVIGGAGSVFDGRYDLRVLKNPTMVKNALAYVLQNFSKHSRLLKHLDEYSSAPFFADWRKLFGARAGPVLLEHRKAAARPEFLSPARSWLASEGWMRARV